MTRREFSNVDIENRIRESVSNITPDIIDSIISDCSTQKGVVIQMTTKKNNIKKFAGIAAAFALVVGGVFGYQGLTADTFAASIMLDVNPSVEIKVDKQEDVLEVVANNDDGKKIIGDMDFRGSDLDVAINALVGSMLRQGYITEIQNSILVSVDGNDREKNERLQEEVSREIDEILAGGGFTGSVISQTIEKNTEVTEIAEKYGITEGKAKLIKEIAAKDNTLTVEELAPLTINELNLLSEGKTRTVDTVKKEGKASDKAYIGAERAKEIVFNDAGVSADDVYDLEVEFDHENGFMIYEVEFDAGRRSYEYDVNAVTGTIVWTDKELDDDYYDDDFDDRYDDWDDGWDDDDYAAPGTTDIGRDAALAAAYKHAGVSAGNVYDLECELDGDDGLLKYEIEFKSGNIEYEYDIKASDGSVLKAEKDFDD